MSSTGVQGEGSCFRLELPLRTVIEGAEYPPADENTAATWHASLPVRSAAEQASAWGALPAPWCVQMHTAALVADADTLYRLAAQAPAAPPDMALTLKSWIDNFDYAAIIEAMRVAQTLDTPDESFAPRS